MLIEYKKQGGKMTETEDLGIKIGSKLEAKWTTILDKTEESLLSEEINIKIREVEAEANQKLIELCKKQIAEEKEKFK